jgi:hypothetical protein
MNDFINAFQATKTLSEWQYKYQARANEAAKDLIDLIRKLSYSGKAKDLVYAADQLERCLWAVANPQEAKVQELKIGFAMLNHKPNNGVSE